VAFSLTSGLGGMAKIPRPAIPAPTKPPRIAAPSKVAKQRLVDRFPTEVGLENRRLTGVTRKLTGGFQQSPARFLPKTRSLQVLAGRRIPQ
jgi:hypothetical protein